MQPWINPFLTALSQLGVIAKACRAVGISYSSVMVLKAKDADFAHALEEARDEAVDAAEGEVWRRGVQGYDEPVVYQGQLTPVWERDEHGEIVTKTIDCEPYKLGDREFTSKQVPVQARDASGELQWLSVRKYSDSLLTTLIKGRRKQVFADRTELVGDGGGPVAIDDVARAARVAQLMSLAQARKASDDEEGFV